MKSQNCRGECPRCGNSDRVNGKLVKQQNWYWGIRASGKNGIEGIRAGGVDLGSPIVVVVLGSESKANVIPQNPLSATPGSKDGGLPIDL